MLILRISSRDFLFFEDFSLSSTIKGFRNPSRWLLRLFERKIIFDFAGELIAIS
jgi:hypothetical protein